MRKGFFLVLGTVFFLIASRVVYLRALEGKSKQDVVRLSVEAGFEPEDIVLGKGQEYEFEILNKVGEGVDFLEVESDLFLDKKGHILSLVGEIDPGEHRLIVNSYGKSIFEKKFEFLPKETKQNELETSTGTVGLKRKLVDGKVELVLSSKKDISVTVDEYIAQGLVASAGAEYKSYVKNGLQNLRFEVNLEKDKETSISYELLGGKDRLVYSFGPAEIYELGNSKLDLNTRQGRKKILSEDGIKWISGSRFSWAENLVDIDKNDSDSGWAVVDNLLIKNEGTRVVYKSKNAGSEASYETDSQSDVDTVPLLFDKYKAYVANGELNVFEAEEREEEGKKKIFFKQILP